MTQPTTRTAPAPRGPGRRPSVLLSKAGVTAMLGLAALYTLLPMLWLVLSSTKSRQDLFATNGFAPGDDFALLDNLQYLFEADNGIFLRWLLNTVLYAGCRRAAGHGVQRGRRVRVRQTGLPRQGEDLLPRPARRHGARDRDGDPAVPDRGRGRTGEQLLGRVHPRTRVPVRGLPGPGLQRVIRPRRGPRSGPGGRGGRVQDLLPDRPSHGRARLRDHLPLPVHPDLEQLLPAPGDAVRRGALPGQPRSVRVVFVRALPGPPAGLPPGDRRIAGVRGPPGRPLPDAPAVLEVRHDHAAPSSRPPS